MLFVTSMNIIPGNYKKAVKLFKNPSIPEGVKINEFLWMFGIPDAILLFDAPNEETAGDFILQFGEVAELKTAVAFPIDKMSWM
ncbi:hypothetical protein [[Eubacterium] cellulosolvens]